MTGASSGIGGALAVEMARRGARVGLLARRAAALDEIVRELQAAGSAALSLPADVRDGEAVAAAVEKLRRSF
ncbi:SDR family NAD(P)-dependent oxidoreductase, partial [Acinetobacter baumannii]